MMSRAMMMMMMMMMMMTTTTMTKHTGWTCSMFGKKHFLNAEKPAYVWRNTSLWIDKVYGLTKCVPSLKSYEGT